MRNGISAALGSMLERLNPRERVLLGVMTFVALILICFLVVLLTQRSLSGLEERVHSQDELLAQLKQTAPEIRDRIASSKKTGGQADSEPPALGTQLESHASKAGMGDTVLEMVDQPEEKVGSFLRKSVEVRLRRKPLGELSEFWAQTVNDKARYPVAITRLTVRRRRHEKDSYDVDMIVSSYWPSKSPTGNGKNTSSKSKGRP